MKIGFTSTSFRQIKDIEKIVKIASRCKVDCIEWGGDIHVRTMFDAEKAKKLCEDAVVEICSYGSYYKVGCCDADEWLRICSIAKRMNAKSIRVWLGTCDSEKTSPETYRTLVADMRSICKVAEEFGLMVCPECHDNTFNNNTDSFLRIYKDVGCGNFKTYFQSRYNKLDYDLDRIERTLNKIEAVHISYSEQTREQFPRFDLSYIDKLLDKFVSVGFDGTILVEYTYFCTYLGFASSMKKSVNRIREKVGSCDENRIVRNK